MSAELQARITELEAALEYQKYGGRLLGDMVEKQLKDIVAAVGAEHMIDEDGDGDYGAIFELLFELRTARDAAIARAVAAETKLTQIETFCEENGSEIYTDDIYTILDGKS